MRSTSALARCALALGGAALCASAAACTQLDPAAPSPSATPTESAGAVATDPFSLRVGDCIDDGLGEGEVVQVPVVDCAREHRAEAYHSEKLPDGEYPGLEQVKKDAVEVCLDSFEAFAGISYDDSQQLDFAWYYPTAGSWSTGDREVLCLMMRIDPETGHTVPTKGTLRGFGE